MCLVFFTSYFSSFPFSFLLTFILSLLSSPSHHPFFLSFSLSLSLAHSLTRRTWVEQKADLLFLPAVMLGAGVLGLLVGFPIIADIFYAVCVWIADFLFFFFFNCSTSSSFLSLRFLYRSSVVETFLFIFSFRPPHPMQKTVFGFAVALAGLALLLMAFTRFKATGAIPLPGTSDQVR